MITKTQFCKMMVMNSVPFENKTIIRHDVDHLTADEKFYLSTFSGHDPCLGIALEYLGWLNEAYSKDVKEMEGVLAYSHYVCSSVTSYPELVKPQKIAYTDNEAKEIYDLTMRELLELLPDEESKSHDD